jgi:hypothetical protein
MQNFAARLPAITSERWRVSARPSARRLLAALAAAVAVTAMAPAARAADVDIGVSVQISQPGVYGRIDIGKFPQPSVIVAQPVIISPPRTVVVRQEPVYMWVPQGHRKNWKKHCREYGACGVPVVFVRHDWYDNHVRPRASGRGHDDDDGHGKGKGKGQGQGKGRD